MGQDSSTFWNVPPPPNEMPKGRIFRITCIRSLSESRCPPTFCQSPPHPHKKDSCSAGEGGGGVLETNPSSEDIVIYVASMFHHCNILTIQNTYTNTLSCSIFISNISWYGWGSRNKFTIICFQERCEIFPSNGNSVEKLCERYNLQYLGKIPILVVSEISLILHIFWKLTVLFSYNSLNTTTKPFLNGFVNGNHRGTIHI